jgi:hypothetical protein
MYASDSDSLVDCVRGPSPEDAASSLAYWRTRLARLPLRRVGARREARAMVMAWEERLRRAEIERYGDGLVGRAVAGVAVLRGMGGAAIVRRLLGVLMPRRVLLGVAVVVVGAAVTFGVVLGMVADALF